MSRPSLSVPLETAPSSTFRVVMEGNLKKKSPKGFMWQDRWFVLETPVTGVGGLLKYYKTKAEKQQGKAASGELNLTQIPEIKVNGAKFEITLENRTFELQASTPAEALTWGITINNHAKLAKNAKAVAPTLSEDEKKGKFWKVKQKENDDDDEAPDPDDDDEEEDAENVIEDGDQGKYAEKMFFKMFGSDPLDLGYPMLRSEQDGGGLDMSQLLDGRNDTNRTEKLPLSPLLPPQGGTMFGASPPHSPLAPANEFSL